MRCDHRKYDFDRFLADLERFGWTQAQFGEVYGVHRNTVSNWRDGVPIWVWKVMVMKRRLEGYELMMENMRVGRSVTELDDVEYVE
jgi:hypothetical protein